MSLFLVQHGKSHPSTDADPDPGLVTAGADDVKRIAAVAKGYNVSVAAIVYSTKKRARQTAEIFTDALVPVDGMIQKDGLKPMDDVTVFAQNIKGEDNLMVVGHLPFLSKLTSLLITGSLAPPVFQFQNGGIVCLKKDAVSGMWIIAWALMPHIS